VNSLAFVMYPVRDVTASARFYENVVGLKQSGMKEPWWVKFDIGGSTFGIGNVEDNGVPGTAGSLVHAFRGRSTY